MDFIDCGHKPKFVCADLFDVDVFKHFIFCATCWHAFVDRKAQERLAGQRRVKDEGLLA